MNDGLLKKSLNSSEQKEKHSSRVKLCSFSTEWENPGKYDKTLFHGYIHLTEWVWRLRCHYQSLCCLFMTQAWRLQQERPHRRLLHSLKPHCSREHRLSFSRAQLRGSEGAAAESMDLAPLRVWHFLCSEDFLVLHKQPTVSILGVFFFCSYTR